MTNVTLNSNYTSESMQEKCITKKVFRFKLNKNIEELILEFSKLNFNKDKEHFNSNWQIFLNNNSEIIENEKERLIRSGYSGNFDQKIYKSARYYYSKKNNFITNNTCILTDKVEKSKLVNNYIFVSDELLNNFDNHIKCNLNKPDYKPSTGYEEFLNNNKLLISSEVVLLINDFGLEKSYIFLKLKKTYKNRYYQITKNL